MTEDIIPGPPQPEAPRKPSVDLGALEAYFQSIEEPFRETRDGQERVSKGINGTFVVLFIFSLIPVIPMVASRLMWRFSASTIISFHKIHFHLASFWFWWIAFFVATLAALLVAVKVSSVSNEERKAWLSPPHMRFAYCYAVVDEIAKYETNHLGRHLDTALNYFDECTALFLPRPVYLYAAPDWQRGVLVREVEASHEIWSGQPTWYRLRPETELILKAFREFVPKLRDRLKDRKDLPAVESALKCLAAYQYLEIPELSDSKSEARFEEGIQSLLIFAEQTTALPSYRSEEPKPTPKEKLSLKFFAVISNLTAPFSHENMVVAFFSWLALLFLLFCCGLYGGLRLFSVKVDSTVITALIGGPILAAITAVTVTRVGKKNIAK